MIEFKTAFQRQVWKLDLVASLDATGYVWHILEDLPMNMSETYG